MRKLFLLSLALLASFSLWAAINNTTVTKAGGSQKYIDVATTAASNGDEVTVSDQYIAYTISELVSSSIKDVWYTQSSSGSGSSNSDAVSITGYRSACNKYIGISSSKKYTHYVTNCISFAALYDPRSGGRYCTITATNVDDNTDVVTITNSGTVSSGTKYNVALTGLSASKYYRVVVETNNGSDSRIYQIRLEAPAATPVCPSGLSISGTKVYTEGDKIELTASLEAGNGDITYQWYKGGTAEANKLTGKTNKKLEISDCTTDNTGDYYCVASKTDCSDAVNASAYAVTVNEDTRCFIMPEITSTPSNLASIDVTGGTLADVGDGKTLKMQSTGIGFGNGNAARLKVTLTGSSIVEGTKITIYYNNASSDGSGIGLYNENYEHQVIGTTGVTGSGSVSHTFTAAEAAYYGDVLLIDRNSTGKGIIVGRIEIEDCGPALETYTITFDSDGGSSVASIEVKEGMYGKKPADPTRSGYAFAGWYLNDAPYDWSSAVNADITLVAHWDKLYTVSFNAGDGEGSMDSEEYLAGAEVTLPACTFTAPTGKEFEAWDCADSTITGGKFTMPAKDVEITARWMTELARYKVAYYDDETRLGVEVVEVGSHPTAIGIDSTKNYKIIAAWQLSSVDVDLDDVSGAKNDSITLFARYTDHYATSINFEQYVLDNSKKGAVKSYLTANGYVYTIGNSDVLDSLTYAKRESDRNLPYLGLKIKDANGEVSFLLKANTTLKMKFGAKPNEVTLKFGDATAVAAKDTTYAGNANDIIVKIKTNTGSTFVIKQIMIGEDIKPVVLPAVVTFNKGEGTCDTPELKYIGEALVLPSATAPAGKQFDGWYDKETSGKLVGVAGANYTPTTDVTLYAYYSTATALDNTDVNAKAVKRLENGILVIEKNGVRYNVTGQVIK